MDILQSDIVQVNWWQMGVAICVFICLLTAILMEENSVQVERAAEGIENG